MCVIQDDDPLSSVGVCPAGLIDWHGSRTSSLRTRPLVMRGARVAPAGEVPEYRYDPQRQIAIGPDGRPLSPTLSKEWTSYKSTHTDGDGGDNETWGWEE